MKKFNKILAVAMSAAMLATQAMPVFANEAFTDPTNGTAGGTGSILAYSVEKVVVPTTVRIALNPNGYALNIRYNEVTADTPTAGTKYYVKNTDGSYDRAVLSGGNFVDGTTYYTADVLSGSQIVSLNYGIANKSTRDKVVTVDIAVKQDTSTTNGKVPITFVDAKSKAEAYVLSSNDLGAKQDEMKMYLGIASATAVPTANTYEKASWVSNATVYYKKAAGKYSLASEDGKFASEDAFKAAVEADENKQFYTQTTTIGTEIMASELADVTMTKSTVEGSEAAFTPGNENKANAKTAYKLAKATYGLADDDFLDFDSTQSTLGNKLQLSAIGGVAGFTITGAMNPNVDWTRADTVALKFIPTYTIDDATGTETVIGTALNADPYNQIEVPCKLYVSANTISSTDRSLTLSMPEGVTISKVEFGTSSDDMSALVQGSNYTISDSTFSIVEGTYPYVTGKIVRITYSDGHVDDINAQ